MSSTKPEVHNLSQWRRRRTEPYTAIGNMHKSW